MRRAVQRAVGCFLVASALSGCSWVKASPGDYAAYRRTRLEPSFDARLSAASAYLEAYPAGAYSADVQAYVRKAEPVFFKTREGTLAGLETYLRVLPKGAHAVEARSRVAALREQGARPDGMLVMAQATEERLAAAAKSREKARGEIGFWVEVLSDPDAYKGPLSEGPAELVTAFSLALPAPRCAAHKSPGTVCEKDVSIDYRIPTSRGLEDRELAFTITLEKDETGRPRRARIEGEELFSRLEETYAKKALDTEGIRDRIAAVERAVEVVSGGFEARVSAELACRQKVVAPDILRLACAGMSVVARAASEPSGVDVVTFEPTPPP